MRKIKAAILGTGFIGAAHIEAVRRLGFVEIIAVAQDGQDKANKVACKFDIPKAYGDYRDLLRDQEIDVIHNCTPNYLHYKINKEVLESDKHLLSEKPLTLTSKEAEELYRLSKDKNLVAGVNFVYRQFPMVQHLREMVQNSDLGDIRIVRGHYLQDWLLYETDYNWRIEPEYGGTTRAIGDIGSHLFDLAQYVTKMNITEVLADRAVMIPRRRKPFAGLNTFQDGDAGGTEMVEVTTEDYCSVLVKFDSGARGVFTVSQVTAGKKNALDLHLDGSKASGSWQQEEPFRLELGYRDKPRETVLREKGILKPAARSFAHYPGGHEEGWTDALKNMMYNFYAAVAGKAALSDSVASFKEGFQIALIIDAIEKSAKTGSWQKVRPIDEVLE
ncbi:dehydrogenase [Paenibacillus sp. 32O-W]|uniref:Gfo/Idh/MocA family protein n=1 Tax=Paenibacillus sp. 32O-W TaxID=1695218 RepID=UPI000720BD7E|nr:Gfo/Idh/MocA family oxidoreductase [Paenibacillus sp. 32O-W]ALS28724.1 dehydrogenase [Paenibacillus sp. 32O-W]